MRKWNAVLWIFVAMLCLATQLVASDAVIKGTVTDNAGKPIRGAIVRATLGNKSVTRYSQNDGRYEMTLPAGTYSVSVLAFGFGAKSENKDATQAGDTNFSLSPKWDIAHLSGAEVGRLIPDDTQGNLLKASCDGCHDFAIVMRRRGQTAAEWKSFLPNMTAGRRPNPTFSPDRLNALSDALEKYFGPNSPYLGPDADPPTAEQVNHPAVADAALKATIREYDIPTGVDAFAHSIWLDHDSKTAWFSEIGLRANKIGSFDIDTETFHEYPVPTPGSSPHTGVVGLDGRVWTTLASAGHNLIVLDPETGTMKEYNCPPADRCGGHTVSLDKAGNIWVSGGGSGQFTEFDVKAEKFKNYKFPVPAAYPEGSSGLWNQIPGEPERVNLSTYHVTVDSTGKVWGSILSSGMVVSLDPATGETKEYQAAGVSGLRGLVADSHDNIWFSDWYHHRLGKLDPKTGAFKLYNPPTPGAAPYGIVEEKKTGYIWYADMSGNNITRFDPKTEKFTEFPLPSRPSYPRFIDVAKDGRVWFSEYWAGKIGVLNSGDDAKMASAK